MSVESQITTAKEELIYLYNGTSEISPAILQHNLKDEQVSYKITLTDRTEVAIYMDENLDWCEMDLGITERSRVIGPAIEDHSA
jgi:hypothetical protein